MTWSDDEVIAELVAVKGIGLWTAQMFLMFQLERGDVLPVGDLGIRRAIERAYGLDELPDTERMEADRGAMAAEPDARLPLPVALAAKRARVGDARLYRHEAVCLLQMGCASRGYRSAEATPNAPARGPVCGRRLWADWLGP